MLPADLLGHHPTIRINNLSVGFYLSQNQFSLEYSAFTVPLDNLTSAFTASFSRYISALGGFGGPERTVSFVAP